MLRHRSFWVILLVTAIVGLGTLLSEHDDYPVQVRIQWTGYDTARYSIVQADTLLPLTLNSNCFLAIGRYFDAPKRHYAIHSYGDTVVKVNKMFIDNILADFQYHGIHGAVSPVEQLTLRLAPRQAKVFRPELKGVEFDFADQCGLAGEPRLSPDTVTLYGPEASLAKVSHLYTAPQKITDLKDTCVCTLALDPVWERYPDLRVSSQEVYLFVPVAHYTEKKFSVPVNPVFGPTVDDQVRVRLYPERVEVTLWVAEEDYDRVLPDMVQATVYPVSGSTINSVSGSDGNPALPVRITSFPAYTRVKSVSPSTLQYVVIR